MIDYITPARRLAWLDRRRARRQWLWTWLLVLLVVFLLGVLVPIMDAWGAQPSRASGVRADGAAYNCWWPRRSPLQEFCVFYLAGPGARR